MKNKGFLALLLLFCLLLPAFSQTSDDQDDDVVKITTNLVQIDAVVTKDGKLVTDLTADDFEIYEDGRKQTITSFAFISNVPGSTSRPANAPREKGATVVPFSPVKRDDPHRTIAFVVDDLGLSAESMHQVRKQLRKFVAEQLQPNDLVAIIRTGRQSGTLQQFTNDQRLLSRAVEQLRWNIRNRVGVGVFTPVGGLNEQPFLFRSVGSSMTSLRFIVDAMGHLPGRKSLVLLSDSLPRESQDEIFGERGVFRDVGPSVLDKGGISYTQLLNKIAEKAIRNSVVIYGVDTQGLAITGITAADSFRGDANQIAQQMQETLATRSRELWARREGSELLSRQTGGFLVRNSNDFQLDRILQDQSGYYLLGYRPTKETFNRRFHHIKAKVKRSGMTLRTRYGFFGVSEDEAKLQQLPPHQLTNLALQSPFRAQDIEVGMTSFFADHNAAGAVVRSFVYLDVEDLTFKEVNGKKEGSIELQSAIFGDNGILVEQLKRGATITLSESDYEKATRDGIRLSIDMPVKRPGAYQVRVAVRDQNSSKIGSAGEFVSVPNLKDKSLAVSGIVLGNVADYGGQANAANQAVANPGNRRFKTNSNLYFVYLIYNAAMPSGTQLRNLAMQAKLFRDGKNVFTGPELPIEAGNQRDLNRLITNGVIRLTPELEPGDYYLQVVVTEKDSKSKVPPSVVQWVDFELVNRNRSYMS